MPVLLSNGHIRSLTRKKASRGQPRERAGRQEFLSLRQEFLSLRQEFLSLRQDAQERHPDARRTDTPPQTDTRKRRGDIHVARMAGLNIRPPLGALTGTGVWGGALTFPGTRAWPVEIPAAFRPSFRSYALSLPCEDRMRLGQATKKARLSLVSALAFHYLCGRNA